MIKVIHLETLSAWERAIIRCSSDLEMILLLDSAQETIVYNMCD